MSSQRTNQGNATFHPKITLEDLTTLIELLVEGRTFALKDNKYQYDSFIRRFTEMLIKRALDKNDMVLMEKYTGYLNGHLPSLEPPLTVPIEKDEETRKAAWEANTLEFQRLLIQLAEEEAEAAENGHTDNLPSDVISPYDE